MTKINKNIIKVIKNTGFKKTRSSEILKLSRIDLKRIKNLNPTWQLDDKQQKLSNDFKFQTPLEAFMFVSRIVVHAEVFKHYPTITIEKDMVSLLFKAPKNSLLTDMDIKMTEKINQLSTK